METVFDIEKVNLIVDGHVGTGYGEGEPLQASKDENIYNEHVGAKGEVSLAKNSNSLGQIVVNVKKDSPTNKKLNDLARSGKIVSARVVDKNTQRMTAGGSKAYVQKPADASWGNDVTEREWTIRVLDFEMINR